MLHDQRLKRVLTDSSLKWLLCATSSPLTHLAALVKLGSLQPFSAVIAAMTPIGSEMRWKTKGYALVI